MAYPNFYQQFYPQNTQSQAQLQPQISTNGLIPVPSEMVARNYPIGYGQSVSFKDENAPYLYTKTMGFSQLEPARFEKYRLVKEEPTATIEEPEISGQVKSSPEDLKPEIEALRTEIENLKKEVSDLREGV